MINNITNVVFSSTFQLNLNLLCRNEIIVLPKHDQEENALKMEVSEGMVIIMYISGSMVVACGGKNKAETGKNLF